LKEAHEFARWLGGELPSAPQWDKAGGRWQGRPGPFLGNLTDVKPGDIAVNRIEEGPMRIGEARRDRSFYGCWDMAGNGREWTCTKNDVDERVNEPVNFANPGDVLIRLRGHSYLESEPYLFGEGANDPLSFAAKGRPDLSFRAVLNLPLP
jgi:hypothetical protein